MRLALTASLLAISVATPAHAQDAIFAGCDNPDAVAPDGSPAERIEKRLFRVNSVSRVELIGDPGERVLVPQRGQGRLPGEAPLERRGLQAPHERQRPVAVAGAGVAAGCTTLGWLWAVALG